MILQSQANLISSNAAPWTPALHAVERDIAARLGRGG